MKALKISKRNGGHRLIYVPSDQEKCHLRSLVGTLTKKAERRCPEGVAHGFMPGRSPVSNAMAHVSHRYTLSFDLKTFFDSISERHLVGLLSKEEQAQVLVDGAPRQGLPTSPAVANLAASSMDLAILKWRTKKQHQFVYTRFADDLAFSFDDIQVGQELAKQIPQIVSRCGVKLNSKKTRLQSGATGRRIVTGVAVDSEIHPTRRSKRRLRAAIHQHRRAKIHGLSEWCKLKPPKDRRRHQEVGSELERLSKAWKLPLLKQDKLPDKEAVELADSCIITGDPVYMLGMSTFTTGWTSCMAQPTGQYRRGTLFWAYLSGTRIAAVLTDKTKVIAGVERPTMKTRALLHELRNGVLVYDRVYGHDPHVLVQRLETYGAIPFTTARKHHSGIEVEGHAPKSYKVYLDNLKAVTNVAKDGVWKGKAIRKVMV